MAYVTTNPPQLVMGSVGGVGSQVWSYKSTDANTVVDGASYITNGGALGMRAGDIVIVTDTDAAAGAKVTVHGVDTVSATYPGAVDLTNTYAVTNTD